MNNTQSVNNTQTMQNVRSVMDNKMSNQLINTMGNNKLFPKCSNTVDFLTQSSNFKTDGFDIVGCRLDKNTTFQTSSVYGPPLAFCNTYDKSKLQKTGTLWYPLN